MFHYGHAVKQDTEAKDDVSDIAVGPFFGKIFQSHPEGHGRKGRLCELKGDHLPRNGRTDIRTDNHPDSLFDGHDTGTYKPDEASPW